MPYSYSETNECLNAWKIIGFSEAMSTALVCNKFLLPNQLIHLSGEFISHEKGICSLFQWLVTAKNLQSIKPFLTLKLGQYHKSGSMFSKASP